MVAEPSSGITTSSVISFTPRQVLLQNRNMKQRSSLVVMENDSEVKTQKAEKKKRKELRKIGLLMQSIAAFLDRKGLSRTLSSLQSEASIEVDCWKTNSFDLEDMYSKFCIASESPATAITDNSKEQDSTKDEISKDDGEKDHKKKRKNTVGKDSENGTKSSITDGEIHQLDMNNGSCDMEEVGTEFKEEKKKKKKRSSDSLGDGIEHTAADKGSLNNKKDSDEPSAKSKDKKKKGKSIPDSENVEQYPNRERLMDEVNKLDSELPQSISDGVELDGTTLKSKNKKKRKHETETDVDMKNEENGVNVKKKEQKKRKRSESEEQDYLNDDHVVDKEKAVKKADGLEDMKAIEKPAKDSQSQSTDGNSKPNKKRKTVRREEDSKRDDDANIDSKQVLQEGKEKPGVDSVVVDNGTSGPTPKTTKKETTAEPRTAKAFRRVNVNEVEFVDERLQDNSYWAKDGAETGYGAKAQEVLGQVRGRDFRHEKTKKKRGSYRGGQIDLQSHSIKFNYSDDD